MKPKVWRQRREARARSEDDARVTAAVIGAYSKTRCEDVKPKMFTKNIPDANDIEAVLQLEVELANAYGELNDLSPEQIRGKQILMQHMKAQFNMEAVARHKLASQFDPDYKPSANHNYGISKEERARRDEARSKVFNWSKL